ncbi:helix-turn-helix domain-containing protein [Rhizobium sp. NRK18]|uniref:helix-turn-helix domain-containing protein n=1 Tax=Rhizobium sp. NRK18 TaxID=2964667 RepID=UPI0021C3B138|nr:helix-turn-helix transcriptional regulator [Rhizobium sp. NRK18]MCQ2004840.1 helix-turn-helix domain-containing protein [Rhizobium sp. NRK18]
MQEDTPRIARNIGAGLKRWRLVNRVKQSALAADFGVAQTTVSRWESGLLVPTGEDALRIERLLSARPNSAADAALMALVTHAAVPMHLVCDLTHRLLAASQGRTAEWRLGMEDLQGKSLWRYATPGIRRGEALLERQGWFETVSPEITVISEAANRPEVAIRAGEIRWTRMPLSDGTFARLVTDGVRSAHA